MTKIFKFTSTFSFSNNVFKGIFFNLAESRLCGNELNVLKTPTVPVFYALIFHK